MANNAQNEGQEEQGSWMRTIINALMIYFAINAATSFIGGKFGAQKDVSAGTTGGQTQQAKNTASPTVPALWPLGTKMVWTCALQT